MEVRYTNGFPQAALVEDLRIHPESGVMRAFTFGRSAWEIPLPQFTLPNPDQKVDTSAAVTSVTVPRISSDNTGQNYGVVWADNRNGANWRVQFRGYQYVNNKPVAGWPEWQVDDSSDHTVGAASLSMFPLTLYVGCANIAWSDDRLDRVNHTNHIFTQFICANGDSRWLTEPRVDTASASATSPVIGAQSPLTTSADFALAWQSAGGIYERFFYGTGLPKPTQCSGNQECRVNSTSGGTASRPAMAVDSGDNVFVAWDQSDGTTSRIWISKYGPNGACLKGSGSNCSGMPPSVSPDLGTSGVARSQVQLAVDNSNNLLVTWWEAGLYGPEMIVAKRCTNDLTSCVIVDTQCDKMCRGGLIFNQPCGSDTDCAGGVGQCTSRKCLNGPAQGSACIPDSDCNGGSCGVQPAYCAPRAPVGVTRANVPAVAVDGTVPGNFLLAWQGNVNDPRTSPVWTGFARGFDSSLATVKNDFRLDLAGRSSVLAPRAARSPFANRYAMAWMDNRAGHFDVYTRLMPPQ